MKLKLKETSMHRTSIDDLDHLALKKELEQNYLQTTLLLTHRTKAEWHSLLFIISFSKQGKEVGVKSSSGNKQPGNCLLCIS